MTAPATRPEALGEHNSQVWARGAWVRDYADRNLRPVEVVILARHAADLAGAVLELGAGAGRLTGYLAELSPEVHALDIAEAMVRHGRSAYPQASWEQGDLRDLSRYADGSFGAVVAGYNVIDILDDAERRDLLRQVRRVLAPDGLLVFSSHNRAALRRPPSPLAEVRWRRPARAGVDLLRLPRALANHRRRAGEQRAEEGYAIVNDSAVSFSLLHYYVDRDHAEAQLAEEGYEPLECLDLDGHPVPPGASAEHSSELHYVARRS